MIYVYYININKIDIIVLLYSIFNKLINKYFNIVLLLYIYILLSILYCFNMYIIIYIIIVYIYFIIY